MRFLLVFSIAIALHAEDAKPPTLDTATAYLAETLSTVITPYRSPQGAFARDCKRAKAKVCNWLTVEVDGEVVGNIDSRGNAVISNPDAVLKSLWYYAFHEDDAPAPRLHIDPVYPQDHPWPSVIKTVAYDGEIAAPTKPPTVEELTAQVAEQKQENERLTKMLNAYAGKYQHCDQELTVMQTLGVQPTQAGPVKTQRRPLAPSPQPSTSVDEHAKPLHPAKSAAPQAAPSAGPGQK